MIYLHSFIFIADSKVTLKSTFVNSLAPHIWHFRAPLTPGLLQRVAQFLFTVIALFPTYLDQDKNLSSCLFYCCSFCLSLAKLMFLISFTLSFLLFFCSKVLHFNSTAFYHFFVILVPSLKLHTYTFSDIKKTRAVWGMPGWDDSSG